MIIIYVTRTLEHLNHGFIIRGRNKLFLVATPMCRVLPAMAVREYYESQITWSSRRHSIFVRRGAFFLFVKIPRTSPASTHRYYYRYDKYSNIISYAYLTPVSAFQKLLARIVVKPADRTRHSICPFLEVIIWFGIFSRAEVGEGSSSRKS